MPSTALRRPVAGMAGTLAALVTADGSAAHPLFAGPAFAPGAGATRNAADMLHYLLVLHGQRPDLIAVAASHHAATPAGRFLDEAADAFAVERHWLSRLAVAAGPLPSTPGHAECEATVAGQSHALAMLARSDRAGTAFGAAAALLLDWHALRGVLDAAGTRLGLVPPPCRLPAAAETLAVAALLATTPALERAIGFGAQQLLLQQRGLWTLLEAREIARRDA